MDRINLPPPLLIIAKVKSFDLFLTKKSYKDSTLFKIDCAAYMVISLSSFNKSFTKIFLNFLNLFPKLKKEKTPSLMARAKNKRN